MLNFSNLQTSLLFIELIHPHGHHGGILVQMLGLTLRSSELERWQWPEVSVVATSIVLTVEWGQSIETSSSLELLSYWATHW